MLTVDWGNTNVILIPQSYLTLVSGTFYQLDTDQFRLDLKALEAGLNEGSAYLKTHVHNTSVTVAGTTFARSIEIIPPYSVEFENLQYTVQLVGSNNNIFDVQSGVLVQNQVQVIPTNSAGLVVTGASVSASIASKVEDIHGHIDRAVHINTEEAINGNGYQQSPYNNFSDAVDYAENNGLLTLEIMADATVDRQLKNFYIRGIGQPTIDLNGQNMDKTIIERCTITGSMNGTLNAEQCALINIQNIAGVWLTVSVAGTLTVQTGASLIISRVGTAVAGSPWTLDMNSGGSSSAAVHNITGGMILTSMDSVSDNCHLHFSQGHATIDSSCVLGDIVISGIVTVTDNSGAGCSVTVLEPTNINSPIDNIPSATTESIFSKDLSTYTTEGTAGFLVNTISSIKTFVLAILGK